MMLRGKKGNYPDIVAYFQVALIIVFVSVFMILIYNNFNTGVQANANIDAQIKTTSANYTAYLPTAVDMVFLFMFLAFFGFSIFAARLIPSTPKFIAITIFALILLPFVALFIENIWDGFYQQTTIAAAISGATFMVFIMNHLVYFITFYSAAIGIALLSKEDSSGLG